MQAFRTALIALFLLVFAVPALAKGKTDAQDPTMQAIAALDWKGGPAPLPVTARASVTLPAGTRYLDAANTSKFLSLTQNLPEPDSFTIAAQDLSWFAIIDFSEMGYVKDDEKIDPDALLTTLRQQQDEANTQRIEQKLGALTVKGWSVVPHYDAASHNLEYGLNLGSPDGDNVNYTTRILGRRGVMNVTLVTSPQSLQTDLAAFRNAMKGFAFKPDESYAAYKDGDKIADYGLAALVTGGAAAAAVKTGLLGGLLKFLLVGWKFIAVAVVAGFAALRGAIGRLFGGGRDLGPPPGDAA